MIFGSSDEVPRDIVPPTGLTLADILAADAAVGKPGSGVIPGELLTDAEGMPLGVGESRPITSLFGGFVLLHSDVARLGIDPSDHPSIVAVMPDPKRRNEP